MLKTKSELPDALERQRILGRALYSGPYPTSSRRRHGIARSCQVGFHGRASALDVLVGVVLRAGRSASGLPARGGRAGAGQAWRRTGRAVCHVEASNCSSPYRRRKRAVCLPCSGRDSPPYRRRTRRAHGMRPAISLRSSRHSISTGSGILACSDRRVWSCAAAPEPWCVFRTIWEAA